MEKFAPIIMCAIFVAIAYGLMKLTLKISAAATKKRILAYGRPSENAASALFCSQFGEMNVLTNKWLLCQDTRGRKLYTEIDDIIVLPSCIVCVEVKSLVGNIASDGEYMWHQSVRTRTGEMKELDFANPILQNERHVDAVKAVLEKENVPCPPIYNMVVFTSEKVAFSHEHPQIYSLADSVEYIKALSKARTLSTKQRLDIIRAINHNSPKASRARAYNERNA